MAELELRQVRKSFQSLEVIHGIDLTVEDGSFTVFVGPSGCGKSTLLRMISGLEETSAGEIWLDGVRCDHLLPSARGMAMVFQSYALYPHMSVEENLRFGLENLRTPKPEIATRVDKAADILQIKHLLKRRPNQLSGGQSQRVAIGRAIVKEPKVFLFDEPLSNLDAKLRVQMRAEIKELHQRLRTTTIYVTHDQVEAMTMADKIVVMRDGIVEQVGTPLELYDRPRNVFVAGFIGSPAMNFIEGTLGPDGFVTPDGIRLPALAGPGDAVTYGIRPEHLHLDPENGVEVEVAVLEPTGSETQVIGRIGSQAINAVFRERIEAKPGSRLRMSPDLSAVHLFRSDGSRAN